MIAALLLFQAPSSPVAPPVIGVDERWELTAEFPGTTAVGVFVRRFLSRTSEGGWKLRSTRQDALIRQDGQETRIPLREVTEAEIGPNGLVKIGGQSARQALLYTVLIPPADAGPTGWEAEQGGFKMRFEAQPDGALQMTATLEGKPAAQGLWKLGPDRRPISAVISFSEPSTGQPSKISLRLLKP
jgi:hypothetical protein